MDPRTARMLAEHEQAAASAPPPPTGVVRLSKTIDTWVRANRPLAFAAAIAAIVLVFLVYYWLVALPARQRERADHEVRAIAQLKAANTARQASLDECLSAAKTDAQTRWDEQCRVRRHDPGCALPVPEVDRLGFDESQARNACLTRYSIATQ